MPTTEAEYSKRAEECLRLAGACIAESNRQILIYAAVCWRMLAEEAAGRSVRTFNSNEANSAPSDLPPSPSGS
jgi:hypothetical protein